MGFRDSRRCATACRNVPAWTPHYALLAASSVPNGMVSCTACRKQWHTRAGQRRTFRHTLSTRVDEHVGRSHLMCGLRTDVAGWRLTSIVSRPKLAHTEGATTMDRRHGRVLDQFMRVFSMPRTRHSHRLSYRRGAPRRSVVGSVFLCLGVLVVLADVGLYSTARSGLQDAADAAALAAAKNLEQAEARMGETAREAASAALADSGGLAGLECRVERARGIRAAGSSRPAPCRTTPCGQRLAARPPRVRRCRRPAGRSRRCPSRPPPPPSPPCAPRHRVCGRSFRVDERRQRAVLGGRGAGPASSGRRRPKPTPAAERS